MKIKKIICFISVLLILIFQLGCTAEQTMIEVEDTTANNIDVENVEQETAPSESPELLWIDEMIPILENVSCLDEHITNAFKNAGDKALLISINSDEYITEVNNIIESLEAVAITETELDTYNEDLKNALSMLKDYTSSISEFISSDTNTYDNDSIFINHVLINIDTGDAIDEAFASYVMSVNKYFQDHSLQKEISLDFQISPTVKACIQSNSQDVFIDFCNNYINAMTYDAGQLDINLTLAATDSSWEQADIILNNSTYPLVNELLSKYKGTILETPCAQYNSFISDFQIAIDYAYSSASELSSLRESLIDVSANRSSFDYFLSMSYERATTSDMWARLMKLTLSPNGIHDGYNNGTLSEDEAFNQYIEALKVAREKYKSDYSTEGTPILYAQSFYGFSDDEYKEFINLSNANNVSSDEYTSRQNEIQTEMQNKITIYQTSYSSFLEQILALSQLYEVNVSDYIE